VAPVVVVASFRRASGLPSVNKPRLPAIALLLLGFAVALAARLPEPRRKASSISAPWLTRLAEADANWVPRAEKLPDGRIRYHYRRRQGDPELTVQQIKALIAHPPTFQREREAITDLLIRLGQVGVVVQLTQPRKQGAAAEWDPANRTIRIQPRVVGLGSREFARVLNHEAIHVAQSCASGNLQGAPTPLKLGDSVPPSLASVLKEPLYRQASPLEQRLERQAYAHQHRLELGAELVARLCRTSRG